MSTPFFLVSSQGLYRSFSLSRQPAHTALFLLVVDVKQHYIEWPMAPWPSDPTLKTAGWYLLRSAMAGWRGMSWALLSAAGMSPDEIEPLLENCKKDLLNRKYGWYFGV